MQIIETDRLTIRKIAYGDIQDIFELNEDEEVVRYTSDPPFKNLDEVKSLLEGTIFTQYEKYGLGRWAVIEKKSGLFTGWCGLKFREEENEVDLGYRFRKLFWGKGYATESGRACLQYGFEIKKLDRIVGRVMRDNLASVRVLEKCGMTFCKEDFLHGHQAMVFECFPGKNRVT